MTASSRREIDAPSGLRFSGPLRVSLVVVAAMALVALAFILVPQFGGGPGPGASDEATLSPAVTPSETPLPTAEPTVAPTAEPTPKPEPTPAPMARWTGLIWSDPVTPPFTVHLADLVPWGEGYVAVGTVDTASGPAERILTSPDGVNWTVAFDPGNDHWPRHIAVLGDELLAFSQRTIPRLPPDQAVGAPPDTFIWRSTDGVHWSDPQEWPTWTSESIGQLPAGWDETQYPITTSLVDVASGTGGLVAIGNSFAYDDLVPIVMHSTDGNTWVTVTLPDAPSAIVNSIAATHDGLVIVGGVDIGPDPATAVPAAWYSTDGVTWTRVMVDGPFPPDFFPHGEFGPLAAGADGMVTCFDSREMKAGGWRFMDPWTSADGTSWRWAGPVDAENPRYACGWMASDGDRIVALAGRMAPTGQAWAGVTGAWVSTDGTNWSPLAVSEVLTDPLERFWVVPDGVIYAGVESFWFGTAVVAP